MAAGCLKKPGLCAFVVCAAKGDEVVERVASALLKRQAVMNLDLTLTAAFVALNAAAVASSGSGSRFLPRLLAPRMHRMALRAPSPALLALVCLTTTVAAPAQRAWHEHSAGRTETAQGHGYPQLFEPPPWAK